MFAILIVKMHCLSKVNNGKRRFVQWTERCLLHTWCILCSMHRFG